MSEVSIREGRKEDCKAIVHLLGELGVHEGHAKWIDDIEAFREDGFGEHPWFHTFVAEVKDETGNANIVGFCLYFYSYSMINGRSCHLECLYIVPEWRKHGLGFKLYKANVQAALSQDCTSLENAALVKNTRAFNFYKSMGAVDFTELIGAHSFILDKENMENLINS